MRTASLSAAAALMLGAGLVPALAQDMPNSLDMTCSQASALVKERGQVVIATGPNIFSRYVADPDSCDAERTGVPGWIQTKDQAQCLVGFFCQERVGKND